MAARIHGCRSRDFAHNQLSRSLRRASQSHPRTSGAQAKGIRGGVRTSVRRQWGKGGVPPPGLVQHSSVLVLGQHSSVLVHSTPARPS
eukprot:14041937-Alexandrium_andersonii.AAC.1